MKENDDTVSATHTGRVRRRRGSNEVRVDEIFFITFANIYAQIII